MDVLAGAGTFPAHQVAMKVSQGGDLLERYLWALAQKKNPSEEVALGNTK